MTSPLLVLVESNGSYGRSLAGTALSAGWEVRLLTREPAWYPYAPGDGYMPLLTETGDPEAVAARCRQLLADVDGPVALTSGYEPCLAMASRIARTLGLPGPDPDGVLRAARKDAMRRALVAAGVRVPVHREARTLPQVREAAAEIGVPVVVKPVGSGGSIGVRLCSTVATAAEHFASLVGGLDERGVPMPEVVLVEEYVPGAEFSAEVFDGRAHAITRKHVTAPPCFIETGHDLPVHQPAVEAIAEEAVQALGLTWGPAHVEAKVDAKGPVIVEVNPRLGGGGIPDMLGWCTGRDVYAAHLRRLLGQGSTPRPARPLRHGAIRSIVAAEPCVLEHVETADAWLPGVRRVQVAARYGAAVGVFGDARDRIATVTAVADHAAGARRAAEMALAALSVRTRPLTACGWDEATA